MPELKSMLLRIEELKKLWAIATREVPPPDDDRLMNWCGRFSETEVEHAMLRLSSMLHKGKVARVTSECSRYVGGVLNAEATKTKDKLARMLDRNQPKEETV